MRNRMEAGYQANNLLDATTVPAIISLPGDKRSFPAQAKGWCLAYPFRLCDCLVPARRAKEFSFKLLRPSWLRFAFAVLGGDIGFEIRGLAGGGGAVAAPRLATDGQDFSTRRVVGEQGACAGQMCLPPGTYTFVWDNAHSWFKTKHVWYKFKVVEDASVSRALS